MNPSDEELRALLKGARRIVVVGMSKNPEKDAHTVPRYLLEHGYDVIPVNPTATEILGRKSYASLREVPGPIDLVDVFRPSEDVPPVVDDAIAVNAKTVWMQLGIAHREAAEKAKKAGLVVVEDRCMRTEHRRLLG
jgi:hypothetical protein